MNAILGNWLLRMKTPVGTIEATYCFEEHDGSIRGSAVNGQQTSVLADIAVEDGPDGQRVRWRQSITKPLRLNLSYDVVVRGDTITGESRAGRLPRTEVSGQRA